MKIVTPQGALVLPSTAPRADWLAARRSGITATDIAKVVGVSGYGNVLDVYLDKRTEVDDTAPSEVARWGQLLEDEVAREWARRNGTTVRRVGLLRHRLHAHYLASCDRLSVPMTPLEVKTRSAFVGWDDGIPERVTVQVQWQMLVTGCERVHVAALVGGQRLETYTVERDDTLIDYLRDEADRVWDCVERGVMPDVDPAHLTADSLNRAFLNRAGTADLSDDTDVAALMAAYRVAAADERSAGQAKERAKLALIQKLGESEEAIVGGFAAYTYRAGNPTPKIPAERVRDLIADHPDIADEYVTHRTFRTFRLSTSRKALA